MNSVLASTPVVAKSLAAITDTGASEPLAEDFNFDYNLQFYTGDATDDDPEEPLKPDFIPDNNGMVAPASDTLEDPLEQACIDAPIPTNNFNNHPQPRWHPTADPELQPAPPHIIEFPTAHQETPAV
ncbi:hypothetical protein EDB19DRAFT_2038578 [Suillus lakei]|nr:hypothetical protein EDB19DRAFT_2038578 [Suillus lakei]